MGSIKAVTTSTGETRYKAEAVMGKRRKSKRFDNKRKAQTWVKETEVAMKGMQGSIASNLTFYDAMERFIATIDPEKRIGHKKEVLRLKKTMKQPIANVPLEEMALSDATEHMAYLKTAGLANDSITRDFTLLKVVMKQCLQWYNLPYPWAGLTMYPKDDSRTRIITDAEIDTLVAVSGYRLNDVPVTTQQKVGAMFLFAIETGMREAEIVQLTGEMYDKTRKCLDLPKGITKTRRPRTVPLSNRAMAILKNLDPVPEGDWLFAVSSTDTAASTFIALKKKCGWSAQEDWIRFHDARHLACMRMSKVPTMTALKLAKIMGHSDVKQTMEYWHPDLAEVGDEIRDHQLVLDAGSELSAKLGAVNMTIDQMEAQIREIRAAEEAGA